MTTKKGKKFSKKPAKAHRRAEVKTLTAAQVRVLPRPRTDYEELVDKVVVAWRRHSREIRVPGLTPARLSSLVRAARKAQAAQSRIEAEFERRLRPLRDRRLTADAEAWKGLLDLWAFAKPASERFPAIAQDFGFLAEGLSHRRAEVAEPATT